VGERKNTMQLVLGWWWVKERIPCS